MGPSGPMGPWGPAGPVGRLRRPGPARSGGTTRGPSAPAGPGADRAGCSVLAVDACCAGCSVVAVRACCAGCSVLAVDACWAGCAVCAGRPYRTRRPDRTGGSSLAGDGTDRDRDLPRGALTRALTKCARGVRSWRFMHTQPVLVGPNGPSSARADAGKAGASANAAAANAPTVNMPRTRNAGASRTSDVMSPAPPEVRQRLSDEGESVRLFLYTPYGPKS